MADSNPTRGARLPDDLEEEFGTYRDEHDKTNSEAVRDLLRRGLEAERRETVADLSPVHDVLTQLAGVLAALTIAVGVGGGVGVLPLGTALVWGTSMLAVAAVILVIIAAGVVEPVDERLRKRRTPETLGEVSD